MGLTGYRTFREEYKDNGQEVLAVLPAEFSPDFLNRNTIQIWDVSNNSKTMVNKWIGATLTDRTLHEVTIVNNSNSEKEINFTSNYYLSDEATVDINDSPNVLIGPMGTAHFYCTALLENNNLEFQMRTGSQDDRKL